MPRKSKTTRRARMNQLSLRTLQKITNEAIKENKPALARSALNTFLVELTRQNNITHDWIADTQAKIKHQLNSPTLPR